MSINRLRTRVLAFGLCLMPAGMILAQNEGGPDRDRGRPSEVNVYLQRRPASPEQRERMNEALRQFESMQRRFPGQVRELPLDQLRDMGFLFEEEGYGALGLRVRPVPEVLRSHLDLPEQGGIVVDEIAEDSPAAGTIERNDILLKLGEAAINEPSQLQDVLDTLEGDEITVTLMRQGKQQTVTFSRAASETESPVESAYRIGVAINEPDDAVRAQLGLPEGTGVIVMQVESESAADTAGLKPNDVLIELDGEPIVGAGELAELVQKSGGEPISLELLRDGERMTVEITPDSVPVAEGRPEGPEVRGLPAPRVPRGPGGMRFFGPGVMIDPETGTIRPGPGMPGTPGALRQPLQLREFPVPPPNPEVEQQLEELQEQLKKLREELEALKRDREDRPGRRGRDGV